MGHELKSLNGGLAKIEGYGYPLRILNQDDLILIPRMEIGQLKLPLVLFVRYCCSKINEPGLFGEKIWIAEKDSFLAE